jgi:hypothetical protein
MNNSDNGEDEAVSDILKNKSSLAGIDDVRSVLYIIC